jgi:hypothetical protein
MYKNIEPIDTDIHVKYLCPNKKCLTICWLSLKETQTKNFKAICDYCDTVFRPKRIKNVEIKFVEQEKASGSKRNKTEEEAKETKSKEEDYCFLKDAKNTLVKFGFRKEEAEDMIDSAYEECKIENAATLVKISLDLLRS